MSLAAIALEAGKQSRTGQRVADIIEFIESSWGLGIRLYPVQRVILKVHYGLALDDNPWGLTTMLWPEKNRGRARYHPGSA